MTSDVVQKIIAANPVQNGCIVVQGTRLGEIQSICPDNVGGLGIEDMERRFTERFDNIDYYYRPNSMFPTGLIPLFIKSSTEIEMIPLYSYGLERFTVDCPLYSVGHQDGTTNLNLFVRGNIHNSGTLGMFVHGHAPINVNITLSEYGHVRNSGQLTAFQCGHIRNSGQTTLFTGGLVKSSGNPTLVITGDTGSSGNRSLFIGGLVKSSGQPPLFTAGSKAYGSFRDKYLDIGAVQKSWNWQGERLNRGAVQQQQDKTSMNMYTKGVASSGAFTSAFSIDFDI